MILDATDERDFGVPRINQVLGRFVTACEVIDVKAAVLPV